MMRRTLLTALLTALVAAIGLAPAGASAATVNFETESGGVLKKGTDVIGQGYFTVTGVFGTAYCQGLVITGDILRNSADPSIIGPSNASNGGCWQPSSEEQGYFVEVTNLTFGSNFNFYSNETMSATPVAMDWVFWDYAAGEIYFECHLEGSIGEAAWDAGGKVSFEEDLTSNSGGNCPPEWRWAGSFSLSTPPVEEGEPVNIVVNP